MQLENTEPEHKNWLINDIHSCIDDDHPTISGYANNFYNALIGIHNHKQSKIRQIHFMFR